MNRNILKALMKTNRLFYNDLGCKVTTRNFNTPRKGYRISAISHVYIGRAHFYFLLPLLLGGISVMVFCYELLYQHEIILGVGSIVLTGVSTWSIVTVNVSGLNINGIATIGVFWKMMKLKDAVEKAIDHSEPHPYQSFNSYRGDSL